jgi:hypothetical protein
MLAMVEAALFGEFDAGTEAASIQRALKLIRLTRQIGARRFATSILSDAASLMAEAFDQLTPEIRETGVKVSLDLIGNAPFWSIGARHDAKVGLTALMEGMIALSRRGDWLHFDIGNINELTRIDIAAKRPLISSPTEMFKKVVLGQEAPVYGLALIQAAVHLLGLRPEQVVIATDYTYRVSIFL